MTIDDRTEWLEPDGRGGFASGTTSGVRSRRYHALLLTALTPPTGRIVLVNGFEAWAETAAGAFALTSQRYAPDVVHPDGARHIVSCTADPWPTWEFQLPDGCRIRQEIAVARDSGATLVVWRRAGGDGPVRLRTRPLLSGRDYHSTHHENGAFDFAPERADAVVAFRPYQGLPKIVLETNGEFTPAPDWFRQFLYREERERGLDATEDLASPGEIAFDLSVPGATAVWILRAADGEIASRSRQAVEAAAVAMLAAERDRRAQFAEPLDRAADAYVVARRAGRTILAGYPWFTDWGRDTFIALRGLCLATGRLDDAAAILLEWAGAVSEGMLPNRFPDSGEAPEFNSVDASLWFVVAAREFLQACDPARLPPGGRARLEAAILAIVAGYAAGTRFGIRMDADGLLRAGTPGAQLTWMDAKIGDRVITPRHGKPVEVQALWLNALETAAAIDRRWADERARALASFGDRFWIEEGGYLADVVDADHVPGKRDDTFRPNQILAVGGLPTPLVTGDRARRIVEAVERRLLTPMGLRSLAPGSEGYAPRYEGGPSSRDAVYHQGTVWPWLLGPFVEAWLRVHGHTTARRREARRRFVEPLRAHLSAAGLGHVSEIADAEDPFTPRGCPFQAWSVGELVRIERQVLAPRRRSAAARVPEYA
jgi:predicted glycogen debranching enzyme